MNVVLNFFTTKTQRTQSLLLLLRACGYLSTGGFVTSDNHRQTFL